jgi:zinc D-Ala-D-Ala carboxypeptidase
MANPDSIWPWKEFTREEMMCKCGCGRADMNPEFMNRLVQLRLAYGKPMPVNSGYRCPAHNAAESHTGGNGPHTTGRAADIRVTGAGAIELIALGRALGFTGFGPKQHGPQQGRYLHLDDLPNIPNVQPRPWMWSYP